MSDKGDLQIQPTPTVTRTPAALPVRREAPVDTPKQPRPQTSAHPDAAATTEGNLRGAYAQFFVNPDTHDIVIRVRDSATDEVLSEFPSEQVEAIDKYIREYVQALARRRADLHGGSAT
jgi:hypothetical protein